MPFKTIIFGKIFSNKKVKAVIISHHVYLMGIVPRIAIYKNIPVYTVGIAETPNYCQRNTQ